MSSKRKRGDGQDSTAGQGAFASASDLKPTAVPAPVLPPQDLETLPEREAHKAFGLMDFKRVCDTWRDTWNAAHQLRHTPKTLRQDGPQLDGLVAPFFSSTGGIASPVPMEAVDELVGTFRQAIRYELYDSHDLVLCLSTTAMMSLYTYSKRDLYYFDKLCKIMLDPNVDDQKEQDLAQALLNAVERETPAGTSKQSLREIRMEEEAAVYCGTFIKVCGIEPFKCGD